MKAPFQTSPESSTQIICSQQQFQILSCYQNEGVGLQTKLAVRNTKRSNTRLLVQCQTQSSEKGPGVIQANRLIAPLVEGGCMRCTKPSASIAII